MKKTGQDINPTAPGRSFIFFLFIFLLLAANFISGIDKGLDHSLPGGRGRHIQYIAAAISAKVYGVGGYLYSQAVMDTLFRLGMGDPPDVSEASLIAHFTDANMLDSAVAAASHIPRSVVVASRTGTLGQEDIGYVDFLRMSYSLFGVKYASAYYGYFLILGLSVVFFLAFPVCTPFTTSLFLSIFLISHLALLNTVASLGYELLTVTNVRFFGALGLVPLAYLILAILRGFRLGLTATTAGVVLEAALLAFTLLVRISGFWMILVLVAFVAVSTLQYCFRRQFDFALIRPRSTHEVYAEFHSSILRSSVTALLLVVAIFGAMKFWESYNLSPQYKAEGNITTHLFWHNAFDGLAGSPDINALFIARYGVVPSQVSDWLGYTAAIDELRREGIPEAKWKASPDSVMPVKAEIYERVVRGLYFGLVREHPLWVFENYAYYQPRLVVQTLVDVWRRGALREALRFIPILTVTGLVILALMKRIELFSIFRGAALMGGLALFAALPDLVAGAAPWLIGELIILSICFFYLVAICVVVLLLTAAGSAVGPLLQVFYFRARRFTLLHSLPPNGRHYDLFAYDVMVVGLIVAILIMQIGVAHRLGQFTAVSGQPVPAAGADNAVYPAACKGLAALDPEASGSMPSNENLIVGKGARPKSVTASSELKTQDQGLVDHLFDTDPDDVWHIDYQKSWPVEWVLVDLGAKSPINYIRMLPRPNQPSQFLRQACLLGSDNESDWVGLAELRAPEMSKADWVAWKIPPTNALQYYKLVIPNEIPSQFHTFYSIGKIEFYAARP